jgi:hypothetical protein
VNDPQGGNTGRIAGVFAAKIAAARAQLVARMEAAGLGAQAGWRVHEELINSPEGMTYLLRPIHRTEVAPAALEVRIALH